MSHFVNYKKKLYTNNLMVEPHVGTARRGDQVEDAHAAAVGDQAIDDRAAYSPRAAGDDEDLAHDEPWRIAW